MSDLLEIGDFRFRLDYQVVLVGVVESTELQSVLAELDELFNNGVDAALVSERILETANLGLDVPILGQSQLDELEQTIGDFDRGWDLVELVHYQTEQLQKGIRILLTSATHAKSSRRLIELNKYLSFSS